ncbi:hypothetical protein T492DRAFT_289744 [Pavlovales sp. CCMP2436]|nr:hypothetical protein T492DRAFT_289744 [Pavlovales sp. CCMP2436]
MLCVSLCKMSFVFVWIFITELLGYLSLSADGGSPNWTLPSFCSTTPHVCASKHTPTLYIFLSTSSFGNLFWVSVGGGLASPALYRRGHAERRGWCTLRAARILQLTGRLSCLPSLAWPRRFHATHISSPLWSRSAARTTKSNHAEHNLPPVRTSVLCRASSNTAHTIPRTHTPPPPPPPPTHARRWRTRRWLRSWRLRSSRRRRRRRSPRPPSSYLKEMAEQRRIQIGRASPPAAAAREMATPAGPDGSGASAAGGPTRHYAEDCGAEAGPACRWIC